MKADNSDKNRSVLTCSLIRIAISLVTNAQRLGKSVRGCDSDCWNPDTVLKLKRDSAKIRVPHTHTHIKSCYISDKFGLTEKYCTLKHVIFLFNPIKLKRLDKPIMTILVCS